MESGASGGICQQSVKLLYILLVHPDVVWRVVSIDRVVDIVLDLLVLVVGGSSPMAKSRTVRHHTSDSLTVFNLKWSTSAAAACGLGRNTTLMGTIAHHPSA